MRKLVLAGMSAVLMGGAAFGGVICSGDSAPVAIDLRDEPVVDSISLSWDASWVGGDAGATVVITDNGTEIKRAAGNGEFTHIPLGAGLHEFTYTTYIDDVVQDEVYTAKAFKDWKYEVSDGGAVIVGTTQTEGNVVIPSEIDGYSVVGIGPELFAGCGSLAEVIIPGSVLDIGERAFADCTALHRVEMVKAHRVYIESRDVFAGCPVDLTIDDSEIRRVSVKHCYPQGKVVISFDVVVDMAAGLPEWDRPVLALVASSLITGSNYVAQTSALSGDTGSEMGEHRVVWDMKAQGLDFALGDVVFTVKYVSSPLYCVIDLSAGAVAASYPVSYLADVPEGGWTDAYKTTKLVLRLIEPGSIPTRDAAITKPFYMGVFEVTQKQYELVTGSNPSQYKGDMRPVEKVSWNMVRGNSATYNWPSVTGVDPNSFMGRIQARTGLNFDLPTEAQWEYACRAGTSSSYNNGGNTENDLKQLGRYSGNQSDGKGGYSQHTTVGSYLPNAWGLYDMHGNVLELCLDWFSSGSTREGRGGGWTGLVEYCTSSRRSGGSPSSVSNNDGFRLASRTLLDTEGEVIGICLGNSSPVVVDMSAEPVVDSILVSWNSSWVGGDIGATVVIADNGVEIKRATGVGEFVHTPAGIGLHELTYTTYIDDVAQEEVYMAKVFKDLKYEVVNGDAEIIGVVHTKSDILIPSEINGYFVTAIAPVALSGCFAITNLVIEGDGISMCQMMPGLKQTKFNTAFDTTSTLDYATDVAAVSGVIAAYTRVTSSPWEFSDPVSGVVFAWNDANATFAYFGQMYMEAGKTYVFGSYFDDYAFVKIDGTTVLNVNASSVCTGSFICQSSGWHDVEFRLGDIGGNKGSWGSLWSANFGLGYRDDGIVSTAQSGWKKLIDPGDASLFQHRGGIQFNNCSNLRSVTMTGKSITQMRLIFPDSFDKLEMITITGEPTEIPDGAFAGCAALRTIEIPSTVYKIGGSAFAGCNMLTSVKPSAGYSFAGWFTEKTGGEQVTTERIVTDTMTFYARWTAKQYEVTFDAAGGTVGTANKAVTYDVEYGELPTASCEGYVFLGWTLDGVDVTAETIVKTAESHTLTAKWGVQIGNGVWETTICAEPITLGASPVPPSGEVVIPATIAGRPIVGITMAAFAGNDAVTRLTIPASVTNIEAEALGAIPATVIINDDTQTIQDAVKANVRKVVFAEGATRINDNFFDGCPNLETFDIAESVIGIGTNVFEAASALETESSNGLVLHQGWCLRRVEDNAPYQTIPEGVRGIAAGAFEDEWEIGTVEFPSTLRFVGARAFKDCTGIEDVTLPNGVVAVDREAFRNCTCVQEISLPMTLREVGDGAFANCTMLTALTIPEGVVDIGEEAFSNCWRVSSVAIPASVTTVGAGAFANCKRIISATVPLGLATMEELFPASYNKITSVAVVSGGQPVQMVPGMFRGCTALKSLPLPDLLCEIPEEAFVGCESMASFNLPDTVTNIGARAFKDLAQLEAFAFPTGLVVIGEEAFYGLSQLARVDIPVSIAQIGESAFGGCVGIRAVSLPGDLAPVATIWPDAYDKITSATVIRGNLTASLFEGCAALTHVEMPEGVTSIDMRAFAGCASLAGADVPSSVTNLGAEVFKDCALLGSVSLSRRLTALPDGAFAGCSALEEVIVPESVTSVGNGVFSGCAQLQAVRFVGNAPVCTAEAYDGAPAQLVTYAAKGSRGWDGIPTSKALPEFWPDGTEHEIWPWTPSRFKVVFDKNDGISSAIEVEQVVGTTFLLPDNATRTGAEFCGWWTTADGGSRLSESVRVAQSQSYTAYAHWAFNTYSVKFDANGGDGEMEDQLMTVATRTNLLECAYSRVAYTFVGWAVEPEGEVVYADAAEVVDLAYGQDDVVTLYAKWTANEYEVTFDAAGGTVETASKAVTYDAEYGELPTAARTGHTFIGWNFNDEVITSNTIVKTATDHTLVAQWTANQYVVTFNANGGSVPQAFIDVTYGTAYGELPSATRAGHTFAGWWTAADGGVQVTAESVANIAADHCMYAHWVEIRHDVTFDANGGSLGAESAVRSVLEGSAIGELPTPTRARYAFAGWWTAANGGAQVSASTVVEENVTYYAHWAELEVSYNIVNGVLWSVNLNGATEANIPNGVTRIGSEAFCELVELTKVVMPDSVTSIGECAFFGCENLSEVVWSRNLDSIGDEAFVYAGLTAVNLSNTVVRIVGEQAFAGCDKLQSVVFPNTLTTLGSHVFAVCDELTSVTFYGNAPTIDNSAEETSENFPNGDIYVSWTPAGEKDDDFDIYLDKVTTYVTMRSSGWGVVPGTWQSRPILYLQDEGNVHTTGVDVGEKGTVEESGGGYVVEAKAGETLTEADFSFGAVAKEAYVVNIAAGGKSATVVLKSPDIRWHGAEAAPQDVGSGGLEEGVSEDTEDSAGILASVEDIVAKHGEGAIKAKPTPKSGETVGALPVKTYEGLYYQAAWGDDLGTMTQGEKVQATGDTLYLGVIKQKGGKGFYKITVSEQ